MGKREREIRFQKFLVISVKMSIGPKFFIKNNYLS